MEGDWIETLKAANRTEVTLAGGYVCRLTPDERNAFDEFVQPGGAGHATYREYLLCSGLTRAATQRGADEAELAASMDRSLRADAAMYAAAKAWHAALTRASANR